jgi:hypothetical protein
MTRITLGFGAKMLLVALLLGFSFSEVRGEKIKLYEKLRSNLEVAEEPLVGELVDVIFTVTGPVDIRRLMVEFKPRSGIELVGVGGPLETSISAGEEKQVVVKARFTSSPARLTAVARGSGLVSSGSWMPFKGVAVLRRVVIDEATGQFGTDEVYRNSRLLFRYNHMDGRWLEQGDPGSEPANREIVETLKRLEPALTDSEALCLHSEMFNIGWPKHIRARWDEDKQRWIEDDIFRYYLDERWLTALREGWIDEWRANIRARADEERPLQTEVKNKHPEVDLLARKAIEDIAVDDLFPLADRVLMGTVANIEVKRIALEELGEKEPGIVATLVSILPQEYFKLPSPATSDEEKIDTQGTYREITVRVYGGEVQEGDLIIGGFATYLGGTPEFETGENVIAFLTRFGESDHFHPVLGQRGKYLVENGVVYNDFLGKEAWTDSLEDFLNILRGLGERAEDPE